jgi:RNA recognition motif-containing protein
MNRGAYSAGKRAREAELARKQRDKQEKKRRKREEGPGGIPIASAADIQVAALADDIPASMLVPEGIELPSETPSASKSSRRGPPQRLFIGGLSWDTDDASLRKAFEAYGEVVECSVALDRDTGRSRGFGFVTMANRESAEMALREANGLDLDGRQIRVDKATERRNR